MRHWAQEKYSSVYNRKHWIVFPLRQIFWLVNLFPLLLGFLYLIRHFSRISFCSLRLFILFPCHFLLRRFTSFRWLGCGLHDREAGVLLPTGKRISLLHRVQTSSWAHPATYAMDTGVLSSGVKRRTWSCPLISIQCRGYESLELAVYLHSQWSSIKHKDNFISVHSFFRF
jgi:hypothetical protein